jgi:glutamate formiminotransferase / 5-formyltetrahydrofolate cyclo-ligase
MLLAVPNYSEGRDAARIAAIRAALSRKSEILDRHSDFEHHRTVFTVRSEARPLTEALIASAAEAAAQIDIYRHRGLHPCIGALDVCPVVFLDAPGRARARDAALEVAAGIGASGIPAFLYGDLAASEDRRERAFFREGGIEQLAARMADGELTSDFGPAVPHATGGAALVTARPPLAAFNIELSGRVEVARAVAAELRESADGGVVGVRAIGLAWPGGRSQVSTNVHDPISVPLAAVVSRVAELAAPRGAAPVAAEIVGLVPEAAMAGFPPDLPLSGFDPELHLLERRLAN